MLSPVIPYRRPTMFRIDCRRAAFAVLVGAALCAAGCLPVPLGDPEKARVDARLTGVWEWREENGQINLVVFRPYDDRTWVVDALTGEPGEGSAIRPVRRSTYKGWLTAVKGEMFVTLAPLDTVSLLPGERRQKTFLVARLSIEGDLLTARGIDPSFKDFKDIGTASELEREITASLGEPRMYAKPIKATRWPEDQSPRLEKILEDFGKWK
jgi:hypothetical protein